MSLNIVLLKIIARVSDFIYQHINFSVKLKKVERKITDLQCQFIIKKIAHQEQRAITYFDVLLDIDKHLHEIIKDGRSEKGDITVTLVS